MKKLCTYIMSLLFAISAQAQETSEDYSFEAYWSGFRVGEMRIIINQDNEKFNIIDTINSAGIAKLASNYSSVNIVSGIKKNGKFLPKTYNSHWNRKKESQDIVIEFSQNGNQGGDVISQTITPPDREGKHPEVPAKLKKQVVDPLTSAIVSRETIRAEMKKNPNSRAVFTVPTYDAKRRFDVICAIKGYKQIQLAGKMQNLLHINLRREPLAGFRESDLQEMKEEQQTIDFYLNENFVPVWGAAKAQMGSATIKLVK